jgi:thioredoxin reductase
MLCYVSVVAGEERVLQTERERYDAVVIGGGAAGLSATLVLGRACRRVLLLDAGEQSNCVAEHVGGMLSRDGMAPAEFYDVARQQLTRYPTVQLRNARAEVVHRGERDFSVDHAEGGSVRARRVVLATGLDYLLPDLQGARELWGRSVFGCPYCHGWEIRERPVAVYGRGFDLMHLAVLLRGWTKDVVVFSDGPSGLDAEDRRRLREAQVVVREDPVSRLEIEDGHLGAVRLASGERIPRVALFLRPELRQRSTIPEALGVRFDDGGMVVVDKNNETSVPGVYAAGDTCAGIGQIVAAAAAGANAGVWLNNDLVAEDHGLDQPRTRLPTRRQVRSGSRFEERYGYSRAVVVGDRVLVSGCAPTMPDDQPTAEGAREQALRCFEVASEALREAGASMHDVVRTRLYLSDRADLGPIVGVHGEILGDVRPANTTIICTLADPSWRVEVELEAVMAREES